MQAARRTRVANDKPLTRSLICCSAVGSSIVVRSPGSLCSHTAWIARRNSLPERDLGSTETKRTLDGRATAPSCSSTSFMISPSCFSASAGAAALDGSFSTTKTIAT